MNRNRLGFTAALALCLLAVQPSIGHARIALLDDWRTPCVKWDVSSTNANLQGRPWVITQTNNYRVEFVLRQEGERITGTASWSSMTPAKAFSGSFRPAYAGEPVTGTLVGNVLRLQVNNAGRYVGELNNRGYVEGFTHNQFATERAAWSAQVPVECVTREADLKPETAPTRVALPPATVPSPVVRDDASGRNSSSDPRRALFGGTATATPTVVPAGAPAPASAPSPYCKPGYVWRVARASDLVCVTVASRTRVAEENRTAASRIERRERLRYYGPNTCAAGYVWREAFAGDLVCVKPAIRTLVHQENLLAASRRVGS